MLYLIAIIAGILGALAGSALAFVAAAGAGMESAVRWASSAGAIAGFVLAVVGALVVKGGYRSVRDIATRGAAVTAIMIAVLAAGAHLRSGAFQHLGVRAAPPSVEFEIRLPPTTAPLAVQREAQVELHTDRNQTIARLNEQVFATADGRIILRGTVPLTYQTADRLVVLNLPGDAQRLFKLRLPANPSKSEAFGPWHLVDKIAVSPLHDTRPNDIYAIRYRVL